MAFYIYKYVLNNKIMYIGQTTDIHKRIQNHTKEINFNNPNYQIFYASIPNKISMDIYEYLLIKKYKPIYNITYNNDIEVLCTLNEEPKWQLYIKPEQNKQIKKEKIPLTKEEIRIRQLIGIEKAKAEGKFKGGQPKPKPNNWLEKYNLWKTRGITKIALAKELRITRPTLDKWIREEQKNENRT